MTVYAIELTDEEIDACQFARGRYAWPGELLAHLDFDTKTVCFEEHQAWEWSSDVESDMAGGHSGYQLACPELASKLETFRQRIV